jgi:uncharacterized protein (TIGR03545 family)
MSDNTNDGSKTKNVILQSEKSKPSMHKKKKGIFRYEAFLIIAFTTTLILVYFGLFFSLHLKWLAEKTISKVYGAEVNIAKINFGINPPSMAIKKIEFTNHQKPDFNLFEIGNLSFKLNMHDLLFASFTTEEALMTGVKVNSDRSHKGYVSPKTQKLISVNLNLQENKRAVFSHKSEGNILENALSFSKTKDLKGELEKLGQDFKINDLAKKYEEKLKQQSNQLENYKNFVDKEQFKDLDIKLKALELKINNKAPTLEIISEGKELLKLVKAKKDQVKDLNQQFKTQVTDLKSLKTDLKKDIDEKKQALKAKFKIPDIGPESLAKDFFAETVNTRFYLFKYWLDQIRKNSEDKVQNISSKVLSEKNSEFLKEKIKATMDASKNEKSIKAEIEDLKMSKNQIIHFGSDIRPKFWVKKTLLQGDATKNQDLQNFKGEILNIADDQRLIGKPIDVKFQGDLPKDNIYNMNISAKLNHHIKDINETFNIAADYPISSFKIIDDGSLKLYLNKAATRTSINGKLLKTEIQNLTINNIMNNVDFLFSSSKSDIQKMLEPIFKSISTFNVDIFLKGALNNPDLSIISSLAEKISSGLKAEIAGQLTQFNADLDKKLSAETAALQSKIFGGIDNQESKLTAELEKLDLGLDQQNKSIDGLLKRASSSNLDKITDKISSKLFGKFSDKKQNTKKPESTPTNSDQPKQ